LAGLPEFTKLFKAIKEHEGKDHHTFGALSIHLFMLNTQSHSFLSPLVPQILPNCWLIPAHRQVSSPIKQASVRGRVSECAID
jgi:hypothetical protein